jgi:hypothetical protein
MAAVYSSRYRVDGAQVIQPNFQLRDQPMNLLRVDSGA